MHANDINKKQSIVTLMNGLCKKKKNFGKRKHLSRWHVNDNFLQKAVKYYYIRFG